MRKIHLLVGEQILQEFHFYIFQMILVLRYRKLGLG